MSSACMASAWVAVLLYTAVALAQQPASEARETQPLAVRCEDFPLPKKLEPAVRFWIDMFSKYDSGQVVIHDRENMDIVWQLISLPRDENGDLHKDQIADTISDSLEDVRGRLRRLEKSPMAADPLDKALLAVAQKHTPQALAGAWIRLRAQRGAADKFRAGVERARDYLPEILPILAEEGVPAEVGALPFIESMFDPKARSSAGAAGLWQLMPATARELGLKVSKKKVSKKMDERLNVIKATRAAAKMLRQNYRMLGTWPLAITGYNHGPYGVKRAVKQLGTTDLIYLIENYQKSTWGFASKNFYAEFLAATRLYAELEESFAALVRADLPPAPPTQ